MGRMEEGRQRQLKRWRQTICGKCGQCRRRGLTSWVAFRLVDWAFEMAQQLRKSRQEVGLLVLIDPTTPHFSNDAAREVPSISSGSSDHGGVGRLCRNLKQLDPNRSASYIWAGVKWRSEYLARALKMQVCCAYLWLGRQIPSKLRMSYFFEVSWIAIGKYRAKQYTGRVVLLTAETRVVGSQTVWPELIPAALETHELPGGHLVRSDQGLRSGGLGKLPEGFPTERAGQVSLQFLTGFSATSTRLKRTSKSNFLPGH